MKRVNQLIFTAAFLAALQSCGPKTDQPKETFIQTANTAGLTEIKASEFAEGISKNPHVVNFAKMMIADHTPVVKQLESIAKKKLIELPDTLSMPDQKRLSDMAMFYGLPYDKKYMKMMVDDHVKAIALFTDVNHSTDSTLQAFANKTLPTLKMHLDSAKAVYNSLK